MKAHLVESYIDDCMALVTENVDVIEAVPGRQVFKVDVHPDTVARWEQAQRLWAAAQVEMYEAAGVPIP